MKIFVPVSLVLILAVSLNACSSPAPTPTAIGDPAATSPANPVATLPPLNLVPATPAVREILSVSNTGPGSSDAFVLSEKSMIRVNWQQSSTDTFVMAVVNTDPAQEGTPYGRVIFETTKGPSARFSDYEFIAGQYKVVVENADGPWKVWVEYIGPGN